MSNSLSIITTGAALLLAGSALAGPGISAEYSAEESIETADGMTKTMIYSTPTVERREMSDGGQKMIMINRYDTKKVYTLMPEEKMYMEMSAGMPGPTKASADLADFKIEQTPMGQETLNGVVLNKGKMIMTGKDGSKMGGFMWTTKEGIIMKLDAISVDKGQKDRFKLELSNLKVSKQPADLFEIPKGFEKLDMGKMMMGR
jgi:hypothetical protein